MKFNEKMTWMYALDKSMWGEGIEPNRYFATLSLMLTALSGALCGGGNTLDSWFDMGTAINMAATGGALILVWGLNVAESIMAADKIHVAVLRPLVMLLFMAICFAVSYLLAVIVIVIIMIWLIITLLSGAISGALSSKGSSSSSWSSGGQDEDTYKITDEHGYERTLKHEGLNTYRDDKGDRWKSDGWGNVTRDE